MAHAIIHAEESAKRWGGIYTDYLPIHEWLDEPKQWIGNSLHRTFRHHSEAIPDAERIFGRWIINSEAKRVFVKYICEEHIKEDCDGYIPSAKEWLNHVWTGKPAVWMLRTKKTTVKGNINEEENKSQTIKQA